jgi:hypothetical protein
MAYHPTLKFVRQVRFCTIPVQHTAFPLMTGCTLLILLTTPPSRGATAPSEPQSPHGCGFMMTLRQTTLHTPPLDE